MNIPSGQLVHDTAPFSSEYVSAAHNEQLWAPAVDEKLPAVHNVQLLAPDILRHRVLPNFNAEAEGIKVDDIVEHLIKNIEA